MLYCIQCVLLQSSIAHWANKDNTGVRARTRTCSRANKSQWGTFFAKAHGKPEHGYDVIDVSSERQLSICTALDIRTRLIGWMTVGADKPQRPQGSSSST